MSTRRVKWPNDVLVGERKVAGILVELVDRPAGPVAVVGIGLNVSATAAELPVETATSLALAGAGSLDRTALLAEVLRGFADRFDGWCAAGGGGLRPAYLEACSTLGRDVRVELPDRRLAARPGGRRRRGGPAPGRRRQPGARPRGGGRGPRPADLTASSRVT